jgi:hypothetical protein
MVFAWTYSCGSCHSWSKSSAHLFEHRGSLQRAMQTASQSGVQRTTGIPICESQADVWSESCLPKKPTSRDIDRASIVCATLDLTNVRKSPGSPPRRSIRKRATAISGAFHGSSILCGKNQKSDIIVQFGRACFNSATASRDRFVLSTCNSFSSDSFLIAGTQESVILALRSSRRR